MKRIMFQLCCLPALLLMAGPTLALVVDDFSGDLSAYTKCVVYTNSGADEATSLTRTSYVINANDELEFTPLSVDDKYNQTTFMRDDYSLAAGKRLRVDLVDFLEQLDVSDLDILGTRPAEISLCVGEQKYRPFGAPRENYLTMGMYVNYDIDPNDTPEVDPTGEANLVSLRTVRWEGTSASTAGAAVGQSLSEAGVTGLYIDRPATDLYVVGYETAAGDVPVASFPYTGGANAIGFFSDCRGTTDTLATFDNLEIVDSNANPEAVPGVKPAGIYDFSHEKSPYVAANVIDANGYDFLKDAPVPSAFWVCNDDTPGDPLTVTGHIVFDMGKSIDLENIKIWSRDNPWLGMPKDIKIFGFADDDPTNILGDIDDIEGDPNIVEVWSGAMNDLPYAEGQQFDFASSFAGRYIGMRVDSAYEELNFQIGEIRFNVGVEDLIPGDANEDGKVDGSDVTILAGNWQVGVGGVGGATWAMGDFNGDGAVDGSDVTILAGNWQYGVTAAASAVPEPSTILLIFAGLIALLIRRK